LATLLDAVRSTGNMDVHIKSSTSERCKRVVPLHTSVDEETEANLLKFIINFYQYPIKRAEVLDRFNANIPYSGLNYSVSQDVSKQKIFCLDFVYLILLFIIIFFLYSFFSLGPSLYISIDIIR
jgi:hypothetical protein